MTIDAASQSSTSRRAVLRAGAHAAWAVPAVQIASMVPAFAVSGALTVTQTTLTRTSAGSLTGTVVIKNNGTGDAAPLTALFNNDLMVKEPGNKPYIARTASMTVAGTDGWVAGGTRAPALTPGQSTTLSFTLAPSSAIGNNHSVTFSITINAGAAHSTGTTGNFSKTV